MDAANSLGTRPVALPDAQRPAAFAIPAGGQLVVHQPLTLARLTVAVDALESAEARANAALAAATACRGKKASNWLTNLTASKHFFWVVAGVGVAAAVGTYCIVGPDSANYERSWQGSFNYATRTWWSVDVLRAACISAVVGAGPGVASYFGAKHGAQAMKAKMTRDPLRVEHLSSLAAMHKAAEERPLERAALGRVARNAITNLADLEIYRSGEVSSLLEKIAADADIGDASARQEASRHRGLISALRALETVGADPDGRVTRFLTSFAELGPADRSAIADDLLRRLFDDVVPRPRDLPFWTATRLHTALIEARDAAHRGTS